MKIFKMSFNKYIQLHDIEVVKTYNHLIIDGSKISYTEKIELMTKYNFINNNGLLMK